MKVREFAEGFDVAQVLLIRDVEVRRRSAGAEFLRLQLGDRSGTIPAVVHDQVAAAREVCRRGEPVHVTGRFSRHPRFGPQLVVESVRPPRAEECAELELTDGPARSAEAMESDLRELIATVQDADLQRLLAVLLGRESAVWARFREAPAAKRYHHAYRHGLLEHALSVAQAVGAISATFPGINRDLAVTGALLHDIGKLDAYEMHGDAIAMSDLGRLQGEIALGYYRIRRAVEGLDGFPHDLERALLHIILSHHGSLEYGSPVVPCTREATLVHMVDNLGGRLGSFDRLEKALPDGEQWSPYDKGIGAGAFFGSVAAALEREAA